MNSPFIFTWSLATLPTPNIFGDMLAAENVPVPVGSFVTNLVLTALMARLLAYLYTRFGRSLSNRGVFARNFMLLAVTTMLVISVVKSSLALSLGLVGALSIIRFRAAIKEPEELAYLFVCIAIGLGLGADQLLITTVAFAVIAVVIYLGHIGFRRAQNENLFLTISNDGESQVSIDQIVEVLKAHCVTVLLKRYDESPSAMESAFLVEFKNFEDLAKTRRALNELQPGMTISLLDGKGVF